MKRPEAKIEEYFEKKAAENNMLQYKFTSGVTGVPDRLLIGCGTIALVELKAANGKLSDRQKFVINAIRRHGGKVFVPFSKQDVDAIFTEIRENSTD